MTKLFMARWQTAHEGAREVAVERALDAVGLIDGFAVQVGPLQISFRKLARPFELAPDAEQGWIFGAAGQVEFRQLAPERFVVVAFRPHLALQSVAVAPEDSREVDVEADPEEVAFLWGEARGGKWVEGRIPRPLELPIAPSAEGDHPRLRVRTYRAAEGQAVFVHWSALEASP